MVNSIKHMLKKTEDFLCVLAWTFSGNTPCCEIPAWTILVLESCNWFSGGLRIGLVSGFVEWILKTSNEIFPSFLTFILTDSNIT